MRRVVAAFAFIAAVRLQAQQQTSDRARDSLRADSARVARALGAVVVTAARRLQRVNDASVTTR